MDARSGTVHYAVLTDYVFPVLLGPPIGYADIARNGQRNVEYGRSPFGSRRNDSTLRYDLR